MLEKFLLLYQIPEVINFLKENVSFDAQFWRFPTMVYLSCLFWICGDAAGYGERVEDKMLYHCSSETRRIPMT